MIRLHPVARPPDPEGDAHLLPTSPSSAVFRRFFDLIEHFGRSARLHPNARCIETKARITRLDDTDPRFLAP